MSLENRINDDIKAAMLAREKDKLESLRAIKAAIQLAKTSGPARELTDDNILKIIAKLVKQRKESADIYTAQNRPELAEKELAEASYIEAYLPAQMSPEELETALMEIMKQVGAASPADMGKVMGTATKQLAGKAEGRAISEAVRRLLSK